MSEIVRKKVAEGFLGGIAQRQIDRLKVSLQSLLNQKKTFLDTTDKYIESTERQIQQAEKRIKKGKKK